MPGLTKYFLDPLYRNSLFLMLNTGQVSIFSYVFWLLAGRMAPAIQIGLTTEAIAAAAMIVALSRLGMDDSLTRFFPRSKNPGGFFNALMAILVLAMVAAIAGFLVGLPYISQALLFLREWQFLLLFTGYVLLTSICDMQGTALVAIRRADLAFLQYSLMNLRIPLIFVLGPLGMVGIFLALDIAYLAMLAAGVVLLYRMGVSRDLRIDLGEAKKTVFFSLGSYTSTTIATAPVTLIPILIVNAIGAAQEAYFYLAYTIANFLFMVPDSIAASMFVEGSHDRPLRPTAFKSLRFALLLLIPMVLVVLVFGDRLLLLISSAYSSAAHRVLLLLALSSLFYAAVVIYITVTQVQKNMWVLNYIRLASSGLTLVLGYVFLLKLGLVGIGYAWLLANATVAGAVAWMMVTKKKW